MCINSEAVVKALEDLSSIEDTELAHTLSDELLCVVLDKLGYAPIVEAYKKIPKWYS